MNVQLIKNNNTDLNNELNLLKEENKNLKNQYSNQNDTLNDIFNVFQNLITTTNITHSDISKEDYINVTKKVESAKGLPDGTYDFVSMEELNYNQGYNVAFETLSRNSF